MNTEGSDTTGVMRHLMPEIMVSSWLVYNTDYVSLLYIADLSGF